MLYLINIIEFLDVFVNRSKKLNKKPQVYIA